MDTKDKMNQEKQEIMSELFEDISDKQCIIDRILSEKSKDVQLSESSLSFYAQCKSELVEEQNKGEILFFRKYAYEKILNNYLLNKYREMSLKLTLFEENKSLKEQKLFNELKKILPTLKWEKEMRINGIQYRANTPKVTYSFYSITGKKVSRADNKLLYNGNAIVIAQEMNQQVIEIIERTNPQKVKSHNIICVNNPQNSKLKHTANSKNRKKSKEKNHVAKKVKSKKEKHIKKQFSELNKQAYIGTVEKIAANYKVPVNTVLCVLDTISRKCSAYSDANCTSQGVGSVCYPYHKQCLHYNDFIAKITEKSGQYNSNQIKPVVTKRSVNEDSIKIKPISIMTQAEEKIRTIGLKDFLVKGNTFKCTHQKHTIENVDAMINIDIDGKVEQTRISAGYCEQCKVYFILDSTYQKLKKKGIILCRITDEKVYMKGGSVNGTQLAQESILMQYGYNVSQTEGLTATRRQKILAVMIDNKILSKSEIISYLDFFISQRSSMPNMGIAISKWEDDREFVENYRVGHYSKFGVNAIYRK